jgi:excisionase family DNA binding protein
MPDALTLIREDDGTICLTGPSSWARLKYRPQGVVTLGSAAGAPSRSQGEKQVNLPLTPENPLILPAKPRYIQDYWLTWPILGKVPEAIMRNAAVRSNLLVPEVREVMDIRQASDYLGISPDTLYKYASEGFVPAFKLGNRWRFKRSRLDEWMDRQSDTHAEVDAHQKKPVRPAV